MKKILLIIIGGLISGFLLVTSCTKGWEEMNTDPNNPTEVPATNLLAQSIRFIAFTHFDDWFNMNNVGSYAGHIGKIQYIDESRYDEREGVINSQWAYIYRTGMDLKNAKRFAMQSNNENLVAVIITFEALIFQYATDTWRDIPFTNALKGELGYTNPTYDTQETIYPALLDSLEKAGDLFAKGTIGSLGDGDILFNGDVQKWRRFANSLRLRLANRIADVSPIGVTHLQAVLGDLVKYPIMQSNSDNAFLYWPGVAPYKEPWYEISERRDDHAIGKYLVDYLLDTNDPRIEVYAHPNAAGDYVGVIPGVADDELGELAQYSRIGTRFRDDTYGFSPFMRYSEVLFIISEAAQKGRTTYMTAPDAYEAAVTASFLENGLSTDDADALLATLPFSLENLFMQKWVSLFKESHEAWAEARRSDFPVMPSAPGSNLPVHDRPPFRWPYPTNESNLNGQNLAPHISQLVDRFWGQKMWWDTRTSVN